MALRLLCNISPIPTLFIKLKGFAMALNSLHDLLVDELKDLYNAENQLLKALPKMVKAASHEELKAAFSDHLEITRGQVERLTEIFAKLEENPKGKTCKAMQGLIEEASDIIDEDGEPSVKDAALIASAQRVEHYEMAGYGCVRTFAALLGLDEISAKLQETLDEEGEADKKLTELAETVINIDAEEADEEEDDDEDEDDEKETEEVDDEDDNSSRKKGGMKGKATPKTSTSK